jgi:hypothetical protein
MILRPASRAEQSRAHSPIWSGTTREGFLRTVEAEGALMGGAGLSTELSRSSSRSLSIPRRTLQIGICITIVSSGCYTSTHTHSLTHLFFGKASDIVHCTCSLSQMQQQQVQRKAMRWSCSCWALPYRYGYECGCVESEGTKCE